MPSKPIALSRLLALCAGAADFLSGLGFVLLPGLLLRVMGLSVPGPETLVYLRFVGVFVALVGFAYLWALLDAPARLRLVFELTIFFRLGTGIFAAVVVLLGLLAPVWLFVTAADFALVAAQLWLLRTCGAGGDR